MIISNSIRCRKCGDVIYSASRHDFKYCSCKSVAVDGGMDYLKRSGDIDLVEELSIILDDKLVEEMVKQVVWANQTGRNEFGLVCAIARAIRDTGFRIEKNA
jgi:hypothetical protein